MSTSETTDSQTPSPAKLAEQFGGILNTLSTFRTQITALSAQMRALEKNVNKEMKALNKIAQKTKNRPKRAPSGFAKETLISDALCDFMDLETGSLRARTDVTKHIITYIKEHNLQNCNNKKIIEPDDALKKLLKPPSDEDVTYFNLQRYMNKHFYPKNATTELQTNFTVPTAEQSAESGEWEEDDVTISAGGNGL